MPNNTRNPAHDHAWDNGPFAALLLAATMHAWPEQAFFCEHEPAVRRALDFVNRSATEGAAKGLVYNDVERPNCTYGFTDGVAKTGELLFTSLLYYDASMQISQLSKSFNCGNHSQYSAEALSLSQQFHSLQDPDGPLWLAASVDNALPDVWGTAYLVALGLSTEERRQAAMDELVKRSDRSVCFVL